MSNLKNLHRSKMVVDIETGEAEYMTNEEVIIFDISKNNHFKGVNVKDKVMQALSDNNDFKGKLKQLCGNFYFNYYDKLLNILEPQMIVRFLYLCTYMDYENRLVMRDGVRNVPLYLSGFKNILKLSTAETYNTINALIESGVIYITDKEVVYINDLYCEKGGIKKSKNDKVRIFNDGIKYIYENTSATAHKRVALLIRLLPYVNFRYNVLCKNVDEEILELVEPYTLKELCGLLGVSNVTKLKKDLLNIEVKKYPTISFHETKNAKLIAVNPMVYYKGSDINDIYWLEGIFKIKS